MRLTRFRLIVSAACRVAAALGFPPISSATAEQVSLGDLRLDYDGDRWRPRAAGEAIIMEPTASAAKALAPVKLSISPQGYGRDCVAIAKSYLARDLYAPPEITTTTIAGKAAIRLQAHTRCRNATPPGIVACLEAYGHAYLVSATIPTCRDAGNPFTSEDPVQELSARLYVKPR